MVKKKQKKKKKKGKAKEPEVPKREPNLLAPGYMMTAYHMCHNAADFLRERGYPWTYVKPKGNGKKGKKKKVKK